MPGSLFAIIPWFTSIYICGQNMNIHVNSCINGCGHLRMIVTVRPTVKLVEWEGGEIPKARHAVTDCLTQSEP